LDRACAKNITKRIPNYLLIQCLRLKRKVVFGSVLPLRAGGGN
jgi:hypothetical protein